MQVLSTNSFTKKTRNKFLLGNIFFDDLDDLKRVHQLMRSPLRAIRPSNQNGTFQNLPNGTYTVYVSDA